eukprot:SAG25_NODE_1133_length_3837_cov_10.869984_7_plen_325_part_01
MEGGAGKYVPPNRRDGFRGNRDSPPPSRARQGRAGGGAGFGERIASARNQPSPAQPSPPQQAPPQQAPPQQAPPQEPFQASPDIVPLAGQKRERDETADAEPSPKVARTAEAPATSRLAFAQGASPPPEEAQGYVDVATQDADAQLVAEDAKQTSPKREREETASVAPPAKKPAMSWAQRASLTPPKTNSPASQFGSESKKEADLKRQRRALFKSGACLHKDWKTEPCPLGKDCWFLDEPKLCIYLHKKDKLDDQFKEMRAHVKQLYTQSQSARSEEAAKAVLKKTVADEQVENVLYQHRCQRNFKLAFDSGNHKYGYKHTNCIA